MPDIVAICTTLSELLSQLKARVYRTEGLLMSARKSVIRNARTACNQGDKHT